MALIGIDLGTTNSLASIYRGGKVELIPTPLGTFLTPSVVSVEDDGSICVGDVAKERLVSHPHRTAASFKRMMGTDQTMILAGKPFTAQELSSFVLRQLKEDAQRYLGEEVVEAVISVPAYFDDYQRSATKEAGLLAGLRVERLINEPSAAALAGRGSDEEDRSYLVFDLGGGTLDVSIVDCFENVVEIVAVSGDNQLGGNDFDLLIAQYLCAKHCLDYNALSDKSRAVLLRVAEKCKQELTNNKAAVQRMLIEEREYEVFLTNPELVRISYGLFEKISAVTSRALKDSKKTIEEIDEVILVGGSSKMPVIAYYLETHLGKAPVYLGSPDEMVALGAGIFAGIKERNREIKDLVLTDICPFTLGINVVNHSDVTRPVLSPIIERNSILPTSKRSFFTNASDNQEQVRIGIYQGEAYHCDENLFLGEILMEIRRMPKGRVLLEVCFSYDINGILEVDVLDHQKNERKQKVLTSHRLKWTEEEIAARLKDLHTYKMRPPGGERVRLILARGERLFAERTGEERAMVAAMLDSLKQSLYAANDQEALKRSRSADELFASLDG